MLALKIPQCQMWGTAVGPKAFLGKRKGSFHSSWLLLESPGKRASLEDLTCGLVLSVGHFVYDFCRRTHCRYTPGQVALNCVRRLVAKQANKQHSSGVSASVLPYFSMMNYRSVSQTNPFLSRGFWSVRYTTARKSYLGSYSPGLVHKNLSLKRLHTLGAR